MQIINDTWIYKDIGSLTRSRDSIGIADWAYTISVCRIWLEARIRNLKLRISFWQINIPLASLDCIFRSEWLTASTFNQVCIARSLENCKILPISSKSKTAKKLSTWEMKTCTKSEIKESHHHFILVYNAWIWLAHCENDRTGNFWLSGDKSWRKVHNNMLCIVCTYLCTRLRHSKRLNTISNSKWTVQSKKKWELVVASF